MAAINQPRGIYSTAISSAAASLVIVLATFVLAVAQDNADPAAPALPAAARGMIVRVPLPIVGTVDTRVRQMLEQVLADLPKGGKRPTLVLEFRGSAGDTGEASEFERSLALARFLAGDAFSRVCTVAWLPEGATGHAVLPVMACEEIVMHPDARIGAAGAREAHLDAVVRRGYVEIAARRQVLPEAVALGMLDPAVAVYRVETLTGDVYLRDDELKTLQDQIAAGQADTVIKSFDTVFKAGEVGMLDGRQMRLTWHFASHIAKDRRELATELGFSPGSLEEDPSLAGGWTPIKIAVQGAINRRLVNRVERGIQDERTARRVNFVLLEIDSIGGDPAECVRLANYLAALNPSEVRTVAYVPNEARGAAALIALACDHLMMREASVLGGPGAGSDEDDAQLSDLRAPVEQIARAKGRDWSLALAAVDPNAIVHGYTRDGETRYFTVEELASQAESESWQVGSEIPHADGFTGEQARNLGLARQLVANAAEVQEAYQLEAEPQLLEESWAHTLVESLADPRWAAVLLFVACFTLMTEAMTPGIGIPGFISALCFALYFWSQFLHGTAGWLEVTMFFLGLTCLALEIFVLPGVGVFGVGGAVLTIASLVLASQTFVLPHTSQDWSQLPRSLGTVVLAGLGMVAAAVIVRRVLPHTAVYNRLVLAPPDGEERLERETREALVQWVHLVGKRGVAITRLVPAGKARFGDEIVDVLSRSDMVEAGADVHVLEVVGNRVIVEEVA